MRILLTGASGHLGSAVAGHLAASCEVTALTRARLDVCDHRAVAAAVRSLRPDAIVNCAAYTDVDRAEDEPVAALDVNAFAVRALADAAREAGAVLVHYGTDFVFDGGLERPYTEEDRPNPRSVYACSKLIGEWLAREAGRWYVLRVESVFGAAGAGNGGRRTSVDRIIDAIVEGREARVFTDRTVSPSYGQDVAEATRLVLERALPSGVYHCVNTGACTWEDLGREIGRQLGVVPRLQAGPMAGAKLRAERPRHCALSNARLAAAGIPMPTWQDALGRYIAVRRRESSGAGNAPGRP